VVLGNIAGAGPALISPDGSRLAFVGADETGNSQLWVRPLENLAVQALAGTTSATYPFWSPDSRYLMESWRKFRPGYDWAVSLLLTVRASLHFASLRFFDHLPAIGCKLARVYPEPRPSWTRSTPACRSRVPIREAPNATAGWQIAVTQP